MTAVDAKVFWQFVAAVDAKVSGSSFVVVDAKVFGQQWRPKCRAAVDEVLAAVFQQWTSKFLTAVDAKVFWQF